MATTIDFSVIDSILNTIGGFIFGFVELLKIIFNNITFILLFLFFIGMIWAVIKIFDLKKHLRNQKNRGRSW